MNESKNKIMNKYRNKKINGYDSTKEYKRALELKQMEKNGDISNLREQVVFELIPNQKINGVLIERKCTYKADFVYLDENFVEVVEDVKGYKTEVYKLKKKLMLFIHGIIIKEI